jgi:hypothetical protein
MTSDVIERGHVRVDAEDSPGGPRPGKSINRTEYPMTTTTTIAEQYIDAFNESDRDARRSLLARTFTADATYVDPVMSGQGLDGLDAMIGGVQAQFPGHEFRLTGKVDGYGDRLRFAWELYAPGSDQPFIAGTDFATLSPDGRFQSVTGFLDLMPSVAS